ncbi:Dcd1p [Sugiyamaella lignohabitans]|uniref:Deoxycytidylate deaminase n=1 Tax=Sugiyamaella lignohabitans TaxID=796027 RepID=A0A167CVB6_9ASCO|nr:Dcd1p [Sugiyamaella lignohabitans]ANB12146.1 Dcd1p [Sugiyamaella lignohabitans]
MLIGVSGNISSGKKTVRKYLQLMGFAYLTVSDSYSDLTNGVDKWSLERPAPVKTLYSSDLPTPPESDTQQETQKRADGALEQFQSMDLLLEFATVNWSNNYVVEISDLKSFNDLCKRPFFLHVAVDAPALLRWERYQEKTKPGYHHVLTFQEFIAAGDKYLYGPASGAQLHSKAQVVIVNNTDSITELYVNIGKLNLTDPTRLRPSWDAYFMQLADLAALRSNCMKRRVGCVIVKEKRIVATGYNGTPRGLVNCNEGGCKRCNQALGSGAGLSTCLCLHAEENAILEAGRDRLGLEAIIYCNTCPCLTCSIKIVQSGIREVVYSQSYSMDSESAKVLEAGGILLRQYTPPKHGIVMS